MEKIVMPRPELCDGCQDCEKACEKLYGLKRLNIVKVEESYFLLSCQQCEIPICAEVCPVRAYRQTDRIQTVIWEKCLGCGLCLQACPFGALNLVKGQAVQKCDLCLGEQPACLKACTNGAIAKLDLESLARDRHAEFLSKSRITSRGEVKREMNYLSLIFSGPEEGKI